MSVDMNAMIEQYRPFVAWAKDVTPLDGAFWKKPAKWRGHLPFEITPDVAADYRQWRAENPKRSEELVDVVARFGYTLSVKASSVAMFVSGRAYAGQWSMPDAGYQIAVDAPSPSEALIRVAWCVLHVASFDLTRLRGMAEPAPWEDPWG